MNHLVFLDAMTGELEKILGGMKTMLVKIIDSAQTSLHPANPGESLYLLINIYGIHVLVIIVLLVLRNLIRQEKGGSMTRPVLVLIDKF